MAGASVRRGRSGLISADEIELEENLQRKDLTAGERSKTVVKLAETAAEVLKEQAEFRADSTQKSPGRPKEPGSLRDVAERIGIPEATIRAAQKHVETAEAMPVFTAPDVKQYHVLEARAGSAPRTRGRAAGRFDSSRRREVGSTRAWACESPGYSTGCGGSNTNAAGSGGPAVPHLSRASAITCPSGEDGSTGTWLASTVKPSRKRSGSNGCGSSGMGCGLLNVFRNGGPDRAGYHAGVTVVNLPAGSQLSRRRDNLPLAVDSPVNRKFAPAQGFTAA